MCRISRKTLGRPADSCLGLTHQLLRSLATQRLPTQSSITALQQAASWQVNRQSNRIRIANFVQEIVAFYHSPYNSPMHMSLLTYVPSILANRNQPLPFTSIISFWHCIFHFTPASPKCTILSSVSSLIIEAKSESRFVSKQIARSSSACLWHSRPVEECAVGVPKMLGTSVQSSIESVFKVNERRAGR
jgi:hypothetical protein